MGQSFRGQVVVVTGASSGIGRATALAFSREGARVVLGARRKDLLEEAAAAMRRGGREARAVPCNVAVPAQAQRLVQAATERWDRLDVLVANAGIGLTGEFAECSRDDLRMVMDVNYMGVVHWIQAALPFMLNRGSGTIVIVSSVLGWRGVPRFAGYCATKAALNALSESLRTELAPRGVHVLLCAPGLTDTEFFLRRLGTPGPEPIRDRFRATPPEAVAARIVDGVRRRRARVVVSFTGALFVRLCRYFPRLADRAAALWHRRTAVQPPAAGGDDGDPRPA